MSARTRSSDLGGESRPDTSSLDIDFFKSSYSSDTWNCVEVGLQEATVVVRDSKDAHGPTLHYALGTWHDFVSAIRSNSFTRPTNA